MQSSLIVSLTIDGFPVWHQFKFDYDTEFWGFLQTITQIRNTQVNRRILVNQQIKRLRADFLTFFKPTIAPYNDPKEVERLRRKAERHAAGVEPVEESSQSGRRSECALIRA